MALIAANVWTGVPMALSTIRRRPLVAGVFALIFALAAAATPAFAATVPPWVDAWAGSPQPQTGTPVSFTDQTLRMVVHLHAGGGSVRVRLANTFGDRDVTFGHVTVAVRASGAAVGAVHAVPFAGLGSVTVAKGAEVTSDTVAVSVRAGQDLAVSLYVRAATGPATYHRSAHQTSYLSTPGDHSTETGAGSFTTTTGSWYFLDAVSVHGGGSPGTIVALGDSITDGSGSAGNANHRWPDRLSDRLRARTGVPAKSVVDEGIAGNAVLTDLPLGGPSALHRLTRDVLVRRGLTDVILLEGVNDLRSANPPATADQIIAGYQQIIDRVHTKGARVFGATLTPVEGSGRYTTVMEQQRQKLNAWIAAPGHFDGFVDFARAVQDPADPLRMLPAYDSGDHLHPNDAGYRAMGDAIDLTLFN
jgi:lysophospholipase L1-like esterase